MYCPLGSAWPSFPGLGNYTLGGTNSSTFSAQAVCPAGYYCSSGVKIGCPDGTFIGSQGTTQASLCQPCPAGYYCGPASTSGTLCGGDTVYCPSGSSSPVPVDIGYYTIGTPGLRSGETICPLGQYCIGGVNFLCPAGVYGGSNALTSSACSGTCSPGAWVVSGDKLVWIFYLFAGSYCPSGSTSATQLPCPAGSYCLAGLPISCPVGTYNPSLGGSSLSSCLNCTAGRFSAAVGANSSMTCALCAAYESSAAGASTCWPGIIGSCCSPRA